MNSNHHRSPKFSADGRIKITTIPKKDGGLRLIHEPQGLIADEADVVSGLMKEHLVRAYLRERLPERRIMRGGLPGLSLADNVVPHKMGRHFFIGDVYQAYANVDIPLLATMMEEAELRNPFDQDWEITLRHIAQDENAGPGLVTGVSAVTWIDNSDASCTCLDRFTESEYQIGPWGYCACVI